jgi:hypothetical protein
MNGRHSAVPNDGSVHGNPASHCHAHWLTLADRAERRRHIAKADPWAQRRCLQLGNGELFFLSWWRKSCPYQQVSVLVPEMTHKRKKTEEEPRAISAERTLRRAQLTAQSHSVGYPRRTEKEWDEPACLHDEQSVRHISCTEDQPGGRNDCIFVQEWGHPGRIQTVAKVTA